MNESITIVLPIPNRVLSPNCMIASQRGRFMKATAAKKCRRLAQLAVEEEQLETLPWNFIEIKPVFYFQINRKRDRNNYMAMLKSTIDGIVDAGLILDDNSEHIRETWPEMLIDENNPRVEILIERLK